MAAATLAVQQIGSQQVVLHTGFGVLGDGVIQTLKLLGRFSRSGAKCVGIDIVAATGLSKDSRGLVGH